MRVYWFIMLKVAEILGIIVIPHFLGRWVHTWCGNFFCYHEMSTPECMPMWFIGFASLFLVVMCSVLLWIFLALNWKLAGKITKE